MQITDWTEPYLAEFENSWTKYREMVAKGISKYAEVEVRDLFQELSLISAHSEVRLSVLESQRDNSKFQLHLLQIKLLRVFDTGAMNKRVAQVENDKEYQTALEVLQDKENDLTVGKAYSRAAELASNALSREISARLKG